MLIYFLLLYQNDTKSNQSVFLFQYKNIFLDVCIPWLWIHEFVRVVQAIFLALIFHTGIGLSGKGRFIILRKKMHYKTPRNYESLLVVTHIPCNKKPQNDHLTPVFLLHVICVTTLT